MEIHSESLILKVWWPSTLQNRNRTKPTIKQQENTAQALSLPTYWVERYGSKGCWLWIHHQRNKLNSRRNKQKMKMKTKMCLMSTNLKHQEAQQIGSTTKKKTFIRSLKSIWTEHTEIGTNNCAPNWWGRNKILWRILNKMSQNQSGRGRRMSSILNLFMRNLTMQPM